jgi:hypothetical protein
MRVDLCAVFLSEFIIRKENSGRGCQYKLPVIEPFMCFLNIVRFIMGISLCERAWSPWKIHCFCVLTKVTLIHVFGRFYIYFYIFMPVGNYGSGRNRVMERMEKGVGQRLICRYHPSIWFVVLRKALNNFSQNGRRCGLNPRLSRPFYLPTTSWMPSQLYTTELRSLGENEWVSEFI